ncbi:hypothetical protein, partial [Vibrio neptunius]
LRTFRTWSAVSFGMVTSNRKTFPSPHRDPITKGGELNKVDTTGTFETASRSCLAQLTVIPNRIAQ